MGFSNLNGSVVQIEEKVKELVSEIVQASMMEFTNSINIMKENVRKMDAHVQEVLLNNQRLSDDVQILKNRGSVIKIKHGVADPLEELQNLQQVCSVQMYQDQFEKILKKVDITETQAINTFIGGLIKEVRMPVQMFNPKSLADTYSLARVQEAMIDASKRRYMPLLPIPKSVNALGISSARNDCVPTISLLALPLTSTPIETYGNNKKVTGENIPNKKCDGQPCSSKALPYGLNDLPNINGSSLEKEYNVSKMVEDCPKISVNTFPNTTSCNAMRVRGRVNKQVLHILIDFGSKHNLLDLQTAKTLGCKLKNFCPLQTDVASGYEIISPYECRGFTWTLQGQTFTTNVMTTPLKWCEMVLGVPWLSTLGSIEWNFKKLRMEFKVGNRKMVLRGTYQSPMQWLSKKHKKNNQVTQVQVQCSSMSPTTAVQSSVKQDAENAIQKFNGKSFSKRTIAVDWAVPKKIYTAGFQVAIEDEKKESGDEDSDSDLDNDHMDIDKISHHSSKDADGSFGLVDEEMNFDEETNVARKFLNNFLSVNGPAATNRKFNLSASHCGNTNLFYVEDELVTLNMMAILEMRHRVQANTAAEFSLAQWAHHSIEYSKYVLLVF